MCAIHRTGRRVLRDEHIDSADGPTRSFNGTGVCVSSSAARVAERSAELTGLPVSEQDREHASEQVVPSRDQGGGAFAQLGSITGAAPGCS